jgi:hypothetical protein
MHDCHSSFNRKNVYFPAGSVAPHSHQISFIATKSNLYFDITFATVGSDPVLYRLFAFHVTNLIPIFFSFGRLSKESVQVRGPLWHFVTSLFVYGEELVAPSPTPQLEDHPLPGVRDCFFNIFAATLHIWRGSPRSATWGRAMTC